MNTKIILIVLVIVLLGGGALYLTVVKDDQTKTEEEKVSSEDEDKTSLLSSVLSKAQEIKSLEYEMVVNANGQITTQKVWLKGKQMKSETESQGQKAIYLLQEDTAYMYMPEQNMAAWLFLKYLSA